MSLTQQQHAAHDRIARQIKAAFDVTIGAAKVCRGSFMHVMVHINGGATDRDKLNELYDTFVTLSEQIEKAKGAIASAQGYLTLRDRLNGRLEVR
jgi:hypothetical protein